MSLFTPIYMKRGLNWNQLQKALAKLRRIDDQNTLRDIALNSPTIQVREAAIIPPSQERPA